MSSRRCISIFSFSGSSLIRLSKSSSPSKLPSSTTSATTAVWAASSAPGGPRSALADHIIQTHVQLGLQHLIKLHLNDQIIFVWKILFNYNRIFLCDNIFPCDYPCAIVQPGQNGLNESMHYMKFGLIRTREFSLVFAGQIGLHWSLASRVTCSCVFLNFVRVVPALNILLIK